MLSLPSSPSGLTRNQESGMENAEKTGVFQIRGSDLGSAREILPFDPDLLTVAGKWSSLPPAVRTGILAMVNATVPEAPAPGAVTSRSEPG
jgi:hypothetical protein